MACLGRCHAPIKSRRDIPDRRRATQRKPARPTGRQRESESARRRSEPLREAGRHRPNPNSKRGSTSARLGASKNGQAIGPSEEPPAHRWLTNAETDHGGAIPRRRARRTARRRNCGREGSRRPRTAMRRVGARPGKDGPRAGGGGHAPQTQPAESEERDPPTGPARHRPTALATPARHEASSQLGDRDRCLHPGVDRALEPEGSGRREGHIHACWRRRARIRVEDPGVEEAIAVVEARVRRQRGVAR